MGHNAPASGKGDMGNNDMKKISLRFRMDKDRDKAALAILDEIRNRTGASYNEIILDKILAEDRNDTAGSESSFNADYVAEVVADRLKGILERQFGHPGCTPVESIEDREQHDVADADAPQGIDEDALSFLSNFGI